ncbi:unnamed protein product [Phytophthora fragariaefolia]|uniref:Unnamed protein product n=1 Tax=Phytophthora fragariaefolia TaxID=1490495 RepID=A0A9W6XYZ0_9STRA|nr:unnamed protein product [Phytophthora fragariaefolia]
MSQEDQLNECGVAPRQFCGRGNVGGGLRSKIAIVKLDICIGIVQFEDDDARGQGYEEEDEDDEEKEEVDVEYVKLTAELLGEVEELSLQVSRMGSAQLSATSSPS